MKVPLSLVFAGAALPALLVCLDAPFKSKIPQPALVFRTKEWWLLWIVNGLLASALIYIMASSGKVDLLTFVGFMSVILGYPALLKMRLFTLRADDPKDEKSIGPQIVLDLAEAFLLPGIEGSIQERTSDLLDQYVELGQRLDGSGNAENFRKIAETAMNYIGGTRIKQNEKEDFSNYIDKLMTDTTTTKTNAAKNIRALFYKVQNIWGI